MNVFSRLGLRKNWVYEAIVSTKSRRGKNAAAMGVWSPDLKSVRLRVYKSSKTYSNLLKEKNFAVNFPSEPGVFYDTLLGDGSLEYERKSLFLAGCPAGIEARVSDFRDLGDCGEFSADVVSWRMEEKPRLFNRAEHLVLESLIAYSKMPAASGAERAFLERKLAENARVIAKTAPGSVFQRLVGRLLK